MKTPQLILFLLCFITFGTQAQNWELVWQDEFSGSNLNEQKWVHEIGTGSQNGLWGWGNSELQYYTPENTTVSNGTLKITAQEEPEGIVDPFQTWNTLNYSSSRIKTDGLFTFRYGKVQARMKTVDGQGFWPAFWMLPSGGSWPCDGEIDIMEQWGNDDNTNMSTGAAHVGICPYEQGGHMYSSFQEPIDQGSYADQFHIYEVRWYENYIQWFIDDELVYEITPSSYSSQFNWPFNNNEWYLILNFAITSSGPSSNTVLPSFIEVDWVRVYQENELSGCTDINASNYNNLATFDNGSCTYEVNFQLDLSCSPIWPNSVNVTSGNDNWSCNGGINLTDDNQDGIWEGTAHLSQGVFSYIYCADNWTYNENILEYAQSTGDWSCTPNTDYTNYANRQININGPVSVNETWGSCEPCSSDAQVYGCTDQNALNFNQNATIDNDSCNYPDILSITVDVCQNANEVRLTGPWWEWNPNGGPIASNNNDGTWTFTFDPSPTENMEYLIVVDGTQEDLVSYGSTNNDWSCTPITDYWSYANRVWNVDQGDINIVYGTCENSCENNVISYSTVEFAVNMNNVEFPSEEYDNVVVNGSWNGWNGWGVILSDENNDGIFEGSTELISNELFEYVVAVTGSADDWSGWGIQWGNGCDNINGNFYTGSSGSIINTSLIAGCPPEEVFGCIDINANNYSSNANVDDGSCTYDILGCTDDTANNYNSNANIDDGSCNFDCFPDWNVIVTDQNHSIFINGTYLNSDGELLNEGSLIGVFYYNSNGDFICAGYTTLENDATQISVMGDDASTEEIDGLSNGVEFEYMIWDILTCQEYSASVNYSSGIDYYVTNGISFIDQISVTNEINSQEINFVQGWSIFSTYIQPNDPGIIPVFNPIAENVIIIKDNLGSAYLPEWNFNGIGDLTNGQGYQIKMFTENTLNIDGELLLPENTAINLEVGWNMIAYLRISPSPCDLVFNSLTNNNQLVIVKDSEGNAYLPEWNFNGIGLMLSGKGYQLKMYVPATFEYLSNDENYE